MTALQLTPYSSALSLYFTPANALLQRSRKETTLRQCQGKREEGEANLKQPSPLLQLTPPPPIRSARNLFSARPLLLPPIPLILNHPFSRRSRFPSSQSIFSMAAKEKWRRI